MAWTLVRLSRRGEENKFLGKAQIIAGIRIVKSQLVLQDIFFPHLQPLCQTGQELLGILQAEDRKHILLAVQLHALIDLPVHMDSQVWDGQERLFKVH